MTDAALLRAYVEHRDQSAFAELVNRHGGMVYAAARRLAGDGDADDVSQAVFLLLSQRANTLRNRPDLGGWLHESARLCAANARRAQARRIGHTAAAADALMRKSAQPPTGSDLLGHLDDAMAKLSAPNRQVLVLRYLEDLTVDQTAERLGLTPAAVMKRSTRGLTTLRNFFARHGFPTTMDGVTACLIGQAGPLPPATLAVLSAAGRGTTTPAAAALARSARRPILPVVKVAAGIAGGTALVAAAVAIIMTGPSAPPLAAPAPRLTPAAPPPAAPPRPAASVGVNTVGTPREAADGFLTALRGRDVERLATFLPPGDDVRRRAEARRYLVTLLDGHYARYPQRLSVQNWSTNQDMAGRLLSGTFDAQPPIDAELGHAALRVEPTAGHWYVTSAEYTDAEARFAGAVTNDLPGAKVQPGVTLDMAQVAKCLAKWQADMPAVNPAMVTDADVPGLLRECDAFVADLHDLAAALVGTDLAVADDDLRRIDGLMVRFRQAMQAHGAAGFREVQASGMKDADSVRTGGRVTALLQAVTARLDAEREAHHTGRRPPAIDADRQIWDGRHNRAVAIPGPLRFPEWLRATAAYQDWHLRHDVRTFITRDDTGNIYMVSAMGAARQADGTVTELLSQVRMYRPDKTLAAVTNWDMFGSLSNWMTLDRTGHQIEWRVDQRRRDPAHPPVLERAVHFDTDGSQHVYGVDPQGTVTSHMTTDRIGG